MKINFAPSYTKVLTYDFGPIGLVLLCAMLMSIQLRLQLPVGKELGSDYDLLPLVMVGLGIVTSIVAVGIAVLLRRQQQVAESQFSKFIGALVATTLTATLVAAMLPEFSTLQLLYFVASAFLFSLLMILMPPKLYAFGNRTNVFYFLRQLWENRALLQIMVRYNVLSRYSQTLLGMLWIILIPLLTSLLLAFVFSVLIRAFHIGDVPFVSFFLSALTFWVAFQQGISQSTTCLANSIGLMNQVYFPREILVIVKLGESLVDLSFTFSAMLLINAAMGVWPNLNYVYLPVLILIQTGITLGAMLFISYLSVMIRDIPQLVGVLLQLMFYLLPILYPISILPDRAAFLVFLNPLANLIDGYREIILYNRPPELTTLYYPIVAAVVLLYTGYKFFKSYEKNLADFV